MMILVASHRRSGTHLAIDTILTNLSLDGPVNLDRGELPASSRNGRGHDAATVVGKTHAHGDLANFAAGLGSTVELGFLTAVAAATATVYVVRDGRDVLVSLYHYMRSYEGIPAELSFSEFIRQPNTFDVNSYTRTLNRVQYWAYHVESWLGEGDSDALVVRFEDLRDAPTALLEPVCRRLEVPLPQKPISVTRTRRHLDGASSLLVGAANAVSRLWRVNVKGEHVSSVNRRGGRVGDFREMFDAADEEFFRTHASVAMRLAGYGATL